MEVRGSFLEQEGVVSRPALRFEGFARKRATTVFSGLRHQGSILHLIRIDPYETEAVRLDPWTSKS